MHNGTFLNINFLPMFRENRLYSLIAYKVYKILKNECKSIHPDFQRLLKFVCHYRMSYPWKFKKNLIGFSDFLRRILPWHLKISRQISFYIIHDLRNILTIFRVNLKDRPTRSKKKKKQVSDLYENFSEIKNFLFVARKFSKRCIC